MTKKEEERKNPSVYPMHLNPPEHFISLTSKQPSCVLTDLGEVGFRFLCCVVESQATSGVSVQTTVPCFLAAVVRVLGRGAVLSRTLLESGGIFYDRHQEREHLFDGFFSAT